MEEISSMTLEDLYKFENQLKCEALQNEMMQNQGVSMKYGKKGVQASYYMEDLNLQGKIRPEDGVIVDKPIRYVERVTIKMDNGTSAIECQERVNQMKQKVEEIKTRKDEHTIEDPEEGR